MYKDVTHEQKKALNREFKSKMLNKIVETISHTEIRDMIGFRGGAVLHLAYSSPRYTNDLDFIWVQSDSYENKSKIISILSENKMFIEGHQMNLNIKKNNENSLRLSYTIETGDNGFNPTFIIESTDKSNEIYELVKRNTSQGYIQVEKPEDILIDKIIATVNRFKVRQSIKDTDVFDMCFLMNKKRFITGENIIKKADHYNIKHSEMLSLLMESSEYIKYNTSLNIMKFSRDLLIKEGQMKLF